MSGSSRILQQMAKSAARAARPSGRDGRNPRLANMRLLAQMLAPRRPHARQDRAGEPFRADPNFERLRQIRPQVEHFVFAM